MGWDDLGVMTGALIATVVIVTIFMLMARICCCIWPTIAKPLSGHMQIGLIKQPCCLCCHIWSDEDYQIDQFKALPVTVKPETEKPEATEEENEEKKPNAWETSTDGNYLKEEALENSFNSKSQTSMNNSRIQSSENNSRLQSLNGSRVQTSLYNSNIQSLNNSKIQSLNGSRNQSALDNSRNQSALDNSKIQSSLDDSKIQSMNGSRNQSALDHSRNQSALDNAKLQSSLIQSLNASQSSLTDSKNFETLHV